MLKPEAIPVKPALNAGKQQRESAAGGRPLPQGYAFGAFRVYPSERALLRGERKLPLEPKVFETLLLLLCNAGRAVSKDFLMSSLWPETFVEEVNLASKISALRKALGDQGPRWRYVETVPKLGYRFLPPVTELVAGARGDAVAAEPARAPRFIALPFDARDAAVEFAFLAHSLPEAVSAAMAGFQWVTVRSSLLAEKLAAQDSDPRTIAREAAVDMLLSGRVSAARDGRVRIHTELVEAASATLLESFSFTAAHDEIFAVEETLVRRIVDRMLPHLSEGEIRGVRRNVPRSARAYELYLRGTAAERQRSLETMRLARDLLREAVEEDGDYAPAWARLGRCYWFLEKYDTEQPLTPELSEWAFQRAFMLQPDLPLAHNYFTSIEVDAGRARQSIIRLTGHAKKYPNSAEPYTGLVQACRYCGLLEWSLAAYHRARGIDPRALTSVAHTWFLLGDFERTLSEFAGGAGYYLDAAAMANLGREAEALELLEARTWRAPLIDSMRACLKGNRAECVRQVRLGIDEARKPGPEAFFYMARHLARCGESERALALLHDVARMGFTSSAAFETDPWLKPLEQCAGHAALVEEISRREDEARAAFRDAGGEALLG